MKQLKGNIPQQFTRQFLTCLALMSTALGIRAAPRISDVRVSPVLARAAVVVFQTDTAVAGGVDFGLTQALGERVESSTPTLYHSFALTALPPARTFYYRVWTRDAAGNETSGDLVAAATTPLPSETRDFIVFDSIVSKNKPDLSGEGLVALPLLYENTFYPQGGSHAELPLESRVRELARSCRDTGRRWNVDIETWSVVDPGYTLNRQSRDKYIAVMRWLREEAPQVRWGYYGLPPRREYWPALDAPTTARHVAWVTLNDGLQPLADAVDELYPSVYTFYDDRAGWVRYAQANVAEARRLAKGKPVYAFLMPTFHESNATIGGRPMSVDQWLLELETIRECADGVVLWGRFENRNWEGDASPLWQATKAFMSQLRSRPSVASPRSLKAR